MLDQAPQQSPLLTPPIYDPPPSSPRASSPLDPLETSGREPEVFPTIMRQGCSPFAPESLVAAESLSQTFRHSGWRHHRQQVADALDRTHAPQSRQNAFRKCGRECYVLRSRDDPTKYKLAASCCHDRFCLPCGTGRSRTIAANLLGYMAGETCRFVTLTLRTNDLSLGAQLDRLYKCFAILRRSPLWKKTQWGGVAFLELKRSRQRDHWHPHFHVLTQGKYIKAGDLCRLWHTITNDSHVVDIRVVKSTTNATQYVTKYASKPMDSTIFEQPEWLEQAIVALAGRRMILTFGKWKGLRMTNRPTEESWERVDTLENLALRTALGDHDAAVALYSACGVSALNLVNLASMYHLATHPPPATTVPSLKLEQLTFVYA